MTVRSAEAGSQFPHYMPVYEKGATTGLSIEVWEGRFQARWSEAPARARADVTLVAG